jgi:hypothetical protein
MVAHGEEKGCVDVAGGSKNRDAILFPPIAIFDEGRGNAGRNQWLNLRDHSVHFIANDKVDSLDAGAD